MLDNTQPKTMESVNLFLSIFENVLSNIDFECRLVLNIIQTATTFHEISPNTYYIFFSILFLNIFLNLTLSELLGIFFKICS